MSHQLDEGRLGWWCRPVPVSEYFWRFQSAFDLVAPLLLIQLASQAPNSKYIEKDLHNIYLRFHILVLELYDIVDYINY